MDEGSLQGLHAGTQVPFTSEPQTTMISQTQPDGFVALTSWCIGVATTSPWRDNFSKPMWCQSKYLNSGGKWFDEEKPGTGEQTCCSKAENVSSVSFLSKKPARISCDCLIEIYILHFSSATNYSRFSPRKDCHCEPVVRKIQFMHISLCDLETTTLLLATESLKKIKIVSHCVSWVSTVDVQVVALVLGNIQDLFKTWCCTSVGQHPVPARPSLLA